MKLTTFESTRSVLRRLQMPVELWIALFFGGLWLAGVAVGLPVNLPSQSNKMLLELHFFGPMVLAALLQLVLVVLLSYLGQRTRQKDPFVMLKVFPLVVLSVFLYFNFKAWMPLVNPRLYDPQFQRLDELGAPLLAAIIALRQAIAAQMPVNVDSWYHMLFFAMFFLSLGIHAVIDTPQRQRQLVLGMCLNLLLGGLSYWIAPAEGPFLYRDGVSLSAQAAQQIMHDLFQHVRATGTLPPGYFTAPLGAMPSLHVAHALFFTLWAARSARGLLIPYVPLLLWILVEAAASGWHYLIDLPVGALLAVLSFALAMRWIPDYTPAWTPAAEHNPSVDAALAPELQAAYTGSLTRQQLGQPGDH